MSSPAADVQLRDGSTVHVRPVQPADRAALLTFLEHMSPEARRLRFFSAGADLRTAAARAAEVARRQGLGLVATTGHPPVIVAHALYERVDDNRGEVAFEVADSLRGNGLATILMAHLAEEARAHGIRRFVADVLPENRRMLEVFREAGFPVRVARDAGVVRVELDTKLSLDTLERFEARERIAAAAALRHFFEPASVAVVGASRRAGSVGGTVLSNIVRSGFDGPVYPVNSRAKTVAGLPAYRSIVELPADPELAVVAVAAEHAAQVAHDCAARGVRALLVLSAGFAESGPDGVGRQEELLAVCRAAGMRLLGPNCLGLMGRRGPLDATFIPEAAPAGRVALLSQSGGVGLALIERASELGLGLSSFVSIGNRADISANDVLEYWEDDDSTDVVLLYLESFGNPRNFVRIARRLSRRKPIVALRAGRSDAGARAAASHTAALASSSDAGLDALLAEAGVLRVDTLGELFDVGTLLASQAAPRGKRTAIVTNAGGPAILCADACAAGDLAVPQLSDSLRRRLERGLPAHASTGNPVDMLAPAGPGEFEKTLVDLAESGEVDALIALFTPVLSATAAQVQNAIDAVAPRLRLPLASVVFGTSGTGPPGGAARFAYPEGAARAIAGAARLAEWRRTPPDDPPAYPDVRRGEAATLLAAAVASDEPWLSSADTAALLGAWGIDLAEAIRAAGPADAGRAAARLGGRVALKALGPEIVHKTELGAVELGLEGEQSVRRAARAMSRRLRRRGVTPDGFLVQREVRDGVEMMVGITSDPLLGPLVVCAAGGTAVELVHDSAVSLAPIGRRGASDLTRSLATFPLLDGYRGAPPRDVAALEDLLCRVAALAAAHREIVELDLNPIMVLERGAVAVDARVHVEPPRGRTPWPALGAEPPAVAP